MLRTIALCWVKTILVIGGEREMKVRVLGLLQRYTCFCGQQVMGLPVCEACAKAMTEAFLGMRLPAAIDQARAQAELVRNPESRAG